MTPFAVIRRKTQMEGSMFQLVSGTSAVAPGAETSRQAELKGARAGSKNPAREGSGVMVRLYNTVVYILYMFNKYCIILFMCVT